MPLSLGSRLCGKNPGGPLSIALYLSLTHLSGASACYLSLLIYLPPARPPLSIAPYLSLTHLSGASACYLSLFIYLPLAVPYLSLFTYRSFTNLGRCPKPRNLLPHTLPLYMLRRGGRGSSGPQAIAPRDPPPPRVLALKHTGIVFVCLVCFVVKSSKTQSHTPGHCIQFDTGSLFNVY